jgi:hypothetical protein
MYIKCNKGLNMNMIDRAALPFPAARIRFPAEIFCPAAGSVPM